MSLCVPEWDGSGGVLGSVVPSNSAFHGNGKVEFVSSRKSHYSEVPDQDAVEVGWNDYEHIDMQGHNGKSPKVQWQYISGRGNGDDGVTPSKPKSEEAVPVAIENADDEMVSWLQYPLDASLERSYCSEFFGELPPSNTQLMKESFGYKPAVRSSLPVNDDRAAIAEAAMMMGAGRAAGLLPQTGVEAFSKVRTLQSPQQQTRWPQNGSNSALKSNPMLPPRRQPIAPSQSAPGTRTGNANFSHFSFHPVSVKTNSRSLAVPNVAQPKRPMAEASTSTGSCIADSTSGSRQEVHVQVGGEQCNGFESSRVQGASPKHGDCVAPGGDCKSVTPADQEMCRQSGVTRDASEKGASCVTQQPDVQEPTITCSSGGYEISAGRAKEAATSTKRKSSEKEDAECRSEDGEGESVDTKKPVTVRGSTTKRSRAAEVHNQSERRRRDRINEKMRALQELIPNSNKTDKASMLDEAIEYLKMLQFQLQMMSMRTGMTLPPMVVPPGLQQHMHMPQMGAMPSMGMGMGMMPMGLPMGMMDMGVSGPGRAGMLMPSHAGPSMNMASSSTVVDMHDLRYQAAGNDPMDPYTAYLARQHQPMQMNQPLGMDKYNAYMLQQHQQHQQQLFPQPQQHQQHHIHQQQGSHMNGGPPL